MGAIGLFFNPWLILIALFIYIMGQQELQMTRISASTPSPHHGPFPFTTSSHHPPHPSPGNHRPTRTIVIRLPFGTFHLPRR
jgi:hypothetical protein